MVEVDAAALRLYGEKSVQKAAKMVADIYSRWKVKLPPKPARNGQ